MGVSRSSASFAVPVNLLRGLVAAVTIALVASACGRSTTLGPEEAVEVMVLDGIDRGRAICIVDAIGDDVDLAKVSGLDVDLTDDELRLLATTSVQCAPTLALTGPMLDQPPLTEAAIAAEIAAAENGVEFGVARLVDEGLEYAVGECLESRLELEDEPLETLEDAVQRSELIIDCREELGLDDPG